MGKTATVIEHVNDLDRFEAIHTKESRLPDAIGLVLRTDFLVEISILNQSVVECRPCLFRRDDF